MICYVCNKQGKSTLAVAVCIVCGMALCPDHVVREELPLWEDTGAGMGTTRRKLPERLPRIVCAECQHALLQT